MLTAKFIFYDIGGPGVTDQSGSDFYGKAVPHRTRIVEGGDLEFKKIHIKKDEPWGTFIEPFSPMLELSKFPSNECSKGFECIILAVRNNTDLVYYAARDCEMYIMNSKGVTVDQCICK